MPGRKGRWVVLGKWGPRVPEGVPATILWTTCPLWLPDHLILLTLTFTWSLTKEALPLGHPGRRPPAPQPQPSSSLLKSEPWLSTKEWLRPHHRAMGCCR